MRNRTTAGAGRLAQPSQAEYWTRDPESPMQDLRSQLMAKLGATPPPEDATDDPPTAPDPLGPTGHHDSAWFAALQDTLPVGSVAAVPADAKLARCQQVTAQAIKALKKAGRGREAKALGKVRDEYLARREKLAWSRVKSRFVEVGASEKAYRSLKQGGADAERILGNLDKVRPEMLAGASPRKLRELLLR